MTLEVNTPALPVTTCVALHAWLNARLTGLNKNPPDSVWNRNGSVDISKYAPFSFSLSPKKKMQEKNLRSETMEKITIYGMTHARHGKFLFISHSENLP